MFGVPFLQSVAEDIVRKYGDDLSSLIVVFPNNRAQLFFNDYLLNAVSTKEQEDHPLWSPTYTTIQSLFQSHSGLQIADPIKLVCLLYNAYMEVLQEQMKEVDDEDELLLNETLDSFYHWGEILLSDFDDVDNNMVDAQMLFRNIKESVPFEKENVYLTDEQRECLERFFSVFRDGNETILKRRFLSLWNLLGPLYARFRAQLLSEQIAYEGMLKRSVLESFDESDILSSDKTYVFVGFNVLNKCEQMLFQKLHKAQKALFYWDCDDFYIGGKDTDKSKLFREAGLFMRDNIAQFPNELPTFHLLEPNSRDVEIIGSSTESAQARYVSTFLRQKRAEGGTDEDTVVVLCNETLLLPVLHSIPELSDESDFLVNVTMGLPIVQTPIYGMMQLLLSFQERLSLLNVKEQFSLLSTTISPLLHNYYLRKTFSSLIELDELILINHRRYFKSDELVSSEEYGVLFQRCQTPKELLSWLLELVRRVAVLFRDEESDEEDETAEKVDESALLCDDLYKETLYRIYTVLTRLSSLLDEGVLQVEFSMMIQLLRTMLSSTSVPFTGNQILGTQVMGFLETRNLDFTNVILLSANEGVLPKSGKESSFIPYSLRKGYGMTTIEHKNSLYAYYFYRLLQRAEHVTVMYNSSPDHSTKGQMSRFLLQLMVEAKNNHYIRKQIASEAPIAESHNFIVEKTSEVIQRLHQLYDLNVGGSVSFSPSSLNSLISCPLRFYFAKLLRLQRKDEISDEVQSNEFGTIFHAAMQYYYEDLAAQLNRKLIQSNDFPDFMFRDEDDRDLKRTNEYKEFYSKIEYYVNKSFKKNYFGITDDKTAMPEMSGLQLMNRDAVVRYVMKMLRVDAQYAPFQILGTEKKYDIELSVELLDQSQVRIKIEGSIDRLDEKEGVVRILDYKTGGEPLAFDTVSELFVPSEKRYAYGLQVFLYSYMYAMKEGKDSVKPAIAYLQKCKSSEDTNVMIGRKIKEEIVSANEYFDELKEGLSEVIRNLFDPAIPFEGARNDHDCKYCDFRSICGVKIKEDR